MNNNKSSNSNERIRLLLDSLGISKTDFCQKTGLAKSALSNYLRGDRQPRQDAISKIAEAYHINPSWLMGYDVPMYSYDAAYSGINFDFDVDHMVHVEQTNEEIDFINRQNVMAYVELLNAAQGCTPEQLKIVIDTLNAFKKKEDQDGKR